MTDLQTNEVEQEARDMNRDPITGTPGSHPVGTGIGAAGGAAAGAAAGSMAGPVGTAVGGVVGAVVGGIAGSSVGESINPTAEEVIFAPTLPGQAAARTIDASEEDLYWQRAFITEPYYNRDLSYDDYAPAYRIGFTDRKNGNSLSWDDAEDNLKSEWERHKGVSRLEWDDARNATRAAWYRADNALTGSDPYGLD